MFLKTENS